MNIKNIASFLLIASLTSITIISCKKNNLVIDKDYTPPSTAKFNRLINTDTVSTYYIKSTNEPFKLAVGLTTVSSVDRTIQFTYSSRTAVAGAQYNAPTSIVIPAGKALDSLAISGLFSGYPSSSKIDTLDIYITGGDVPAGDYNSHHRLFLRKYCEVDLASLSGNYTNVRETTSSGGSPYGPYNSSVTLTPKTATTATIVFKNLWDSGIEATGTIDWSDPANFKVILPQQSTGLDYAPGQPIDVRTSTTGVSTFSSCEGTISLSLDFIVKNYPTAGATAYYSQNYKIIYKR